MGDGGFTKEQLAMAKQLQAAYCSSGTFKAPMVTSRPAPRQQAGRSSTAPPVRMPPSSQTTRSQPGSVLRSSNGLVRPLPSGGHTSTPTPAARIATSQVQKPVPKSTPVPANPTQKKKTVQNSTQPAVKPTPVTQKAALQSPTQSAAAKPASRVSSQPIINPATSPPIAQSVTQPVTHRPDPLHNVQDQDLLSMEPLPVISTPTLVATPVSQDTEMANSGMSAGPQKVNVANAAPTGSTAPSVDLVVNAPAAVREAIKINMMGKPVLWNYMTEAPTVRELSEAEKEGLSALPPPCPADKRPWIRAWHPNQPLRVGPNGEVVDEEFVFMIC
ncbi:hypothetical protein HMPREF1624_02759 [Sporothrix schenckii ATCC 58251]|uniref:Uncharacterized protein n=1 Tax=Sporothrix schenckii (strain ATCC 58251 / de Perez 2211183) TaxID=1391915 RepID=U7Q0Z1_SPOS1|nr:hypothetical protein HMPREF1624_02759 [Sporothrix schenckii ATCC 58251]